MVERQKNATQDLYEKYCARLEAMRDSGFLIIPSQVITFDDFCQFERGMQEDIVRETDPTFGEWNPFSGCPKKGSF